MKIGFNSQKVSRWDDSHVIKIVIDFMGLAPWWMESDRGKQVFRAIFFDDNRNIREQNYWAVIESGLVGVYNETEQ